MIEYRSKYPEKAKAAAARYYSVNKELVKERAKRWRRKNEEKVIKSVKAWQLLNREKVIGIKLRSEIKRRTKKRASGNGLSNGLIEKLFRLQRGKCACCGAPLGDNFHVDHIMPLALGGRNEDSNIQLLRQRCNNQKHAKHPIEFMQSRGFLL